MSNRFWLSVLVVALSSASGFSQTVPSPAETLDFEEYGVLSAAAAQEPVARAPRWILVGARTGTFECDPSVSNGIRVGGCSGMGSLNETPEQLMTRLRASVPGVTADMTADLLRVSQRSVTLDRSLSLPCRQIRWDPISKASEPLGPGSPDFAINVSRVGFNEARNQALVYLGIIDYSDSHRSQGEYLYLIRSGSGWTVVGRMRVWSQGGR